MSRLILLSAAQIKRLVPHFPRSRGLARVDDRRVVSAIVYVIQKGLQWKDAPPSYGPHKTLYNRFIRWSRLKVFDRIFVALVEEAGVPERLMIDSTHLEAHRTVASLLKKRGLRGALDGPKAARTPSYTRSATDRADLSS